MKQTNYATGIAFERFTESIDFVTVIYFLMYEDGTIGTKERSIQVGVSLLNNWSNQDHAQKLFTLAKYMESPCEAITYQIAKDAYINPEEGLKRKAS